MKLIRCNEWKKLAEVIYDGEDRLLPDRSCIVYVPMDNIVEFFTNIKHSPHKYVVISACSDYGISYQNEDPIWADMKKWLDFVAIDENLGYQPLFLPSRCNVAHCKVSDTYSIKMHAFTKATFDEIPSNVVKWYCTNCAIASPRVVPIPFGIPDWSATLIEEARAKNLHKESKKEIGFYINFQNNTAERVAIKGRFPNHHNMKVVIDEISHEDYINNILNSVYVVSPPGNGLDCYRTLEALYCGAIPIIADNRQAAAYEGLPVVKLRNFGWLDKLEKELGFKIFQNDLDNSVADGIIWEQQIDADRKLLGEQN